MNEMQRKQLQGLGGWLVLFQIQIFSTLAGALQMLVLYPIMGMVMKNFMYELNRGAELFSLDIYGIYYSPYTYVFAAVILVLTILCIVFFYKKRLVFRVFFIIESAIYLVGMALFYLYMLRSMAHMYTDTFGGAAPFTGVYTVFMLAFGLLPMLGIAIAFIIALFKSHRVKNTFN